MLNFLGLAPQAQMVQESRPRSFRRYLELANVAVWGEEVKYLFVNLGEIGRDAFPKRHPWGRYISFLAY